MAKERSHRETRNADMKSSRDLGRRQKSVPDAALLLWLERGLHAMFDGIEQEPLPQSMVELVEKDRKGS